MSNIDIVKKTLTDKIQSILSEARKVNLLISVDIFNGSVNGPGTTKSKPFIRELDNVNKLYMSVEDVVTFKENLITNNDSNKELSIYEWGDDELLIGIGKNSMIPVGIIKKEMIPELIKLGIIVENSY